MRNVYVIGLGWYRRSLVMGISGDIQKEPAQWWSLL